MQTIKETVKCPRCGCIALPDSTRCPKCGTAYDGNGVKGIIDSIRYLSNPGIGDTDIRVIGAYYQLTCPRHGKIYVRATVIGSAIKCPFCS